MKQELKDYSTQAGQTRPTRLFEDDLERLEVLSRWLSVQSGGYSFTPAQVVNYLLDLAEAMGKFIRQEPPDSPQGQEEPK